MCLFGYAFASLTSPESTKPNQTKQTHKQTPSERPQTTQPHARNKQTHLKQTHNNIPFNLTFYDQEFCFILLFTSSLRFSFLPLLLFLLFFLLFLFLFLFLFLLQLDKAIHCSPIIVSLINISQRRSRKSLLAVLSSYF